MHATLEPAHDTYQQKANTLLAEVRDLTPEQRSFRPGPDSWSLTEVLHHLALIDHGVGHNLREGLPEGKRRPRLRQRLLGPVVNWVLRTPIKVKAPTDKVLPDPDIGFEEVDETWRQARAELTAQLDKIDADRVGTPTFIHPISGPLTPARVLAFLNDHLSHHMHQVRRIRNHPDFPTA